MCTLIFKLIKTHFGLLLKCVDRYLEKWPGGKPTEQDALRNRCSLNLNKAALELQFIEDGVSNVTPCTNVII